MSARILHVLSQRPLLTGSGISLDTLVRLSRRNRWHQAVAVGVPADDPSPQVGDLPLRQIFPLYFAPDSPNSNCAPDLDFPVPGMSDVMPYASSVWSQLEPDQIEAYRHAWTAHLEHIRQKFDPQLVHTNHLWLVSSLARQVFADIPLVLTCHATGLRQLELCPHLAAEVISGCRRVDHFCVLRQDHRHRLAQLLDIDPQRITVTGAGYREDLFHTRTEALLNPDHLLYVGKYSAAKGLPQLLSAVKELAPLQPGLRLHIAGSGAGPEAQALAELMNAMTPTVIQHGQLGQPELADLMRRCGICVLPSFYEGVPLVLVEAAACGCRLVANALPGITEQLSPCLGERLHLVPLPRLEDVDQPLASDLPTYQADLNSALVQALAQTRRGPNLEPLDLSRFTWTFICENIRQIWQALLTA